MMSTTQEAMKNTFNITSTPVFADKINPGEVGENILTYMKSQSEVLRISNTEPGDYFAGIVYCTRTFCSANINEPNKYDVTFILIDGDGIQFSGKMWGCEEKIDHIDTPLYIEGTSIAYTDNVLRYRIDTFKRYMTEVPKSLFLKEIEGLKEEVNKLQAYALQVKVPSLSTLLSSLLNEYGFMGILKSTTYKPTIGTRLGAKILISNTIINMMDTYKENLCKDIDRDIYISLAIIYMIDLAIKQASQEQNISIQISTQIMNAMYNSGCFSVMDENRIKIQNVFNGLITLSNTKEVYTTPIECLLFNNLLQTIERSLRCYTVNKGVKK